MINFKKAILSAGLLFSGVVFQVSACQYMPFYRYMTLPGLKNPGGDLELNQEEKALINEIYQAFYSYDYSFDDLHNGLGAVCNEDCDYYNEDIKCNNQGCLKFLYCQAKKRLKKNIYELLLASDSVLKKISAEKSIEDFKKGLLKSLETLVMNDQYLMATEGPMHHDTQE